MNITYKDKIDRILEAHEAWLCGRREGRQADFRGFDLSDTDFSGKNLAQAVFCRAKLFDTSFYKSNLCGASFDQAIFNDVDFRKSKLQGATFFGASLSYSHFANADLTGTLFDRAELSGVNFRDTDLSTVSFKQATWRDAEIDSRQISPVLIRSIPLCCPEQGAFIGWKRLANDRIAKLVITENSKRSSAFGRKCRASQVLVVKITSVDGSEEFDYGVSMYNPRFIYNVGSFATVSDFDDDRFHECASGIHFFITRQEAVDYGV